MLLTDVSTSDNVVSSSDVGTCGNAGEEEVVSEILRVKVVVLVDAENNIS